MNKRIIIVGSGATGLIAAIAAKRAGLEPVVLEKSAKWGGTTAMSGGSLWLPGHALMAENGIVEDMAAARRYLNACISQSGPESSEARRDAFMETAPQLVDFLRDEGFEWDFSPFPDYYPEAEDASYGRGVGAKLFDGAELGQWRETLQDSGRLPSIVVEPQEFKPMLMATQNFGNFKTAVRVMLRTWSWRLRGKYPMFIGQALAGRLMVIVQRLGIEVRLNAEVTDLLMQDGKVSGVKLRGKHGREEELHAGAGVFLGAGGFARNEALRRQHQEVGGSATAAVPGDTGDTLIAAMRLGAAVTLMDDSWWHVSVVFPDGSRTVLMWERTFPGSIIVDPAGRRFANEAAPYNDLGRAMMERLRQFDTKHCWLIMDAQHRRSYVFTNILGGVNPRELIDKGFFIKANSLCELSVKCGLPTEELKATISRFNGFAVTGKDEDFGRGESLFDTIYGDEKVTPNPTLGPIENAPFWAVKVYASDLGTKGGLLTDEDGRVLSQSGEPIAGLYASGNTTASVMGRGYPGPGATLGPAGVFAYRAARHAAMHAD